MEQEQPSGRTIHPDTPERSLVFSTFPTFPGWPGGHALMKIEPQPEAIRPPALFQMIYFNDITERIPVVDIK